MHPRTEKQILQEIALWLKAEAQDYNAAQASALIEAAESLEHRASQTAEGIGVVEIDEHCRPIFNAWWAHVSRDIRESLATKDGETSLMRAHKVLDEHDVKDTWDPDEDGNELPMTIDERIITLVYECYSLKKRVASMEEEREAQQSVITHITGRLDLAAAEADKLRKGVSVAWPEDRRAELSELLDMLESAEKLNRACGVIQRLGRIQAVAFELLRDRHVIARPSFAAWLKSLALGKEKP